jgi:hypothetical protein
VLFLLLLFLLLLLWLFLLLMLLLLLLLLLQLPPASRGHRQHTVGGVAPSPAGQRRAIERHSAYQRGLDLCDVTEHLESTVVLNDKPITGQCKHTQWMCELTVLAALPAHDADQAVRRRQFHDHVCVTTRNDETAVGRTLHDVTGVHHAQSLAAYRLDEFACEVEHRQPVILTVRHNKSAAVT